MLQVNIEKIIPVTEARDMFNKIVDEVEGTDELYVLTKNGKPSAVVVGVNHLEKLTGESHLNMQTSASEQMNDPNPANNDSFANNTSNLDDNNSSQDFFSQNNNNTNVLSNEQVAAVTPDAQGSSEVAEPLETPSDNNQSFLTEETVSVPTTENVAEVAEPLNVPQSLDQIQPVPDDFSASIPTAEASSGTTVPESGGIGPIETGATQFATEGNDVLATEDGLSDVDPFASSGTIAENPEEDGLPPNNQNSQV